MTRNALLLAVATLVLPASADAQQVRPRREAPPMLARTAPQPGAVRSGPRVDAGAPAAGVDCALPPGLGGRLPSGGGPPSFARRGGPGSCGTPVCVLAGSACRPGAVDRDGEIEDEREWEEEEERGRGPVNGPGRSAGPEQGRGAGSDERARGSRGAGASPLGARGPATRGPATRGPAARGPRNEAGPPAPGGVRPGSAPRARSGPPATPRPTGRPTLTRRRGGL